MNRIYARKSPMSNSTSMDGIRNGSHGPDVRKIGWDGRGFPAGRSIRNGVFLRDLARRPSRDRIRFDIQRQRIIVADKPAHNRKEAI